MARALLTALYARYGGPLAGNVLRLSVTKVAEGLIRAERHWWTAATEWDWGAADPPSRALRDRAIAAVTLLGARSEDEVADVLRLVPGLAEAATSRRRAVASWMAALYPAGNGLPASLALALRNLAGALDRLGRYQEAVLATRELAGIWRAEGPRLGDAGIAALRESTEGIEVRAEMLRLARERLTRGASIGYDRPDGGLICPTASQ